MAQRAVKFTQADVARIWKAAKSAGETVRVEVHPDGRLVATPVTRCQLEERDNEWDTVK